MSSQTHSQSDLTTANLTEQSRQLADLNISDADTSTMDSPASMNAQLPAAPNGDVPAGQRSESYMERSTQQKRRKYSAELYQFHKGAWDEFK
jgi:hypothetical protein